MAKIKCKCGEEVEIPDDPRVAGLVESMNRQLEYSGKLLERLDKLGEKAPPPPEPKVPGTKVKKKRTDTKHDGFIFVVTEEVEYEEEEGK